MSNKPTYEELLQLLNHQSEILSEMPQTPAEERVSMLEMENAVLRAENEMLLAEIERMKK